jgi:hypothetical protein
MIPMYKLRQVDSRLARANRVAITGAAVVAILGLAGCTAATGTSGKEHTATVEGARAGPPGALPHRINPGNDGTTYEPCTPANKTVVETLGWDWSTRHEAATVDKQTLRGCTWDDATPDSAWGLSQIVGNSPSLDAYRRSNPFPWLPDVVVDGRRALVYTINNGVCVVRVQSQEAGVSTIAGYYSRPAPPMPEICARAIAFTRATIARMPE